MSFRKTLIAAMISGGFVMAMSAPANAFFGMPFGGGGPWSWWDDNDWYDYPPPWYYQPYGYAPYGYGYPGYGWGGYPYYGGYGYAPYAAPAQPAPKAQSSN